MPRTGWVWVALMLLALQGAERGDRALRGAVPDVPPAWVLH